MIRRSRLVASLSVAAAMAAHATGLWVSEPREKIEIAAGAGADQARLGSSFADMVAGAAQPVSDSTVTPNRNADQMVEPTEPGDALRPESPETAETLPPERSEAAPVTQEVRQASALPEQSAPPEAAVPVEIATMAEAALPEIAAEPVQDSDFEQVPEVDAIATPVRPQTARSVPTQKARAPAPREKIEAVPEIEDGLQISRRPQARPPEIKQAAAARQAPEPERRTEVRGSSGNNADRDANRGSVSGTETATTTRQGRDTASRSDAQGNAATSTYPGEVMRHLARVPRPRATSRGAALVQFSIADGGRLASVGLARSSGSSRLDRAALTVVQRAAPFPAPPRGAKRSFSVKIEGR